MFNPTSPVTGGPQTGFTSPTYTLTADNNIGVNGKQWLITATGGTQTGVTVHVAGDPFTLSVFKPLAYKLAQFVSTTVFRKPPRNTYKVIVRKGVVTNTNFPKDIVMLQLSVDVPAGSEVLDAPNLRAALSLLSGAVFAQSAGLGDSLIQNSI